MNIAIIGVGNLGAAMVNGLINQSEITNLYLTKRNINTINQWTNHKKVHLGTDNISAIQQSDMVVFAVQPRHFKSILNEVKHVIKNKLVVSLVTGFKLNAVEAILGEEQQIIRAMPNTAIAVQKSTTCLCSNSIGKSSVDLVKRMFNSLGTTIEISEEQMQAATVVCASGIAFWMRLIRATTQAAIQLGFESEKAQEMSVHTCLGAASLLLESGNHPEQEIDRVTTPRGCTIEGLNEMEHQGLSSSLIKGMVASFEKINDIAVDQ